MKKIVRRGVVLAVLLALGALLAPKLISLSHDEKTPESDEPPPLPTIQVNVHTLTPERLVERLSTTGTIRAGEQVEITSEISGKVVEILFEEGRRVAAGDVLLRIDDSELRAEQNRTVHQLELAQSREARQKELLESGVQSQQEYDFALSQLNVLRAQLEIVEAQLKKTKIRAPFAGIVGLRYVSLGAFVTPQTRITSLQDIDPIKIDFSVPEKYAQSVRPGTEIQFRVAGIADPMTGEVYAVEPSVDATTRSLALRARSRNSQGVLLPGAFADVELQLRVVEDALAVPSMAVIPELGGKKVFVYENGEAAPRPITTGIRAADRVEVTSGLKPGELVIVTGVQSLSPGLVVQLAGDQGA